MTDPAVPDGREEQIRERAEKSTPGPWESNEPNPPAWSPPIVTLPWTPGTPIHVVADVRRYEDAAFIAAAREDVPWLLDRLREARDDNERLRRGNVALQLALSEHTSVCEQDALAVARAALERVAALAEQRGIKSPRHIVGEALGGWDYAIDVLRAALAGQEGASQK